MAKEKQVDESIIAASGGASELLDSPEVAQSKENGRALSPEAFEATRPAATVGDRGPGSRVKKGEPVGSVNIVTLHPEFGKVVLRTPIYEGDDADKVRAQAQAQADKQRARALA